MFKIENLLSLFADNNIKSLLLKSYDMSQRENKGLSDDVFIQLLYLKKNNPEINIVLDPSKKGSYYDLLENTIYLTNLSINAFFHEITHLFSFYFSKFQMPEEFINLKKRFLASQENTSLAIQLLELIKKTKKQITDWYESLKESESESNISNFLKVDYETLCLIEDIIDAIFDGKSFEQGLTYLRNNDEIPITSTKTSGHGCQYYTSNNLQFEEVLADYQSIKLTNPNNELFDILKNILGKDFIIFLDLRCKIINRRNIESNIIKFPNLINDPELINNHIK